MVAKIALVTHTLSGGVGTVVNFLQEAIRRSQRFEADVIVIATSARDDYSLRLLAPQTWRKGVQVHLSQSTPERCWQVGAAFTEFEFQRYQPRSALTHLLNQYDLIQVVAGSPAWGRAALPASRPTVLFAATTVRNERTAIIRSLHGWRKWWLLCMTQITSRIERQALEKVNAVIGESNYTCELFRPYTPPDRLVLGPPGVDIDYFCPADNYRTNGYIISVGRFTDPRKNIRLLFEAYQRLQQKMSDPPRLVLAGHTGISPGDHEYAKDLGIDRLLEVRQDLSMQDLRNLYQNSAMFVLSSDEEGLGIVILEAMASGLPVISTDCGGPPTAISHETTGLLTPVRDVKALADAMLQLIQDSSLRRQMGLAGRLRSETRFSIQAAGEVYLRTYESLLA